MKKQINKGKIPKDGKLSDEFDYHRYISEFKRFLD